ncbi:MAG TPA: Hpt domain-containing protein, partial [bacterium]
MSARLEHLDAEEVRELRRLFLAQSGELLEQMQETLVALERDGLDGEGVRLVKRALHTVKGDATSMGFEAVGLLCHRLEDVLAIAAAEPTRAAAALETLFAGADGLAAMLAALAAGEEPQPPAAAEERCEAFLMAERAPAARMAPLSPEERLEAAAATGRGLGLFFVEAAVHP